MTVNLGAEARPAPGGQGLWAESMWSYTANARSLGMDFYSWKGEELQSSANMINDHFIVIPINWAFQERGRVRCLFVCSFVFVCFEMKVRPGRLMFLLEIGDSQLPESPVWGESCSMRVTRVLFLSVTKSKKTSFLGSDCIYRRDIYIYDWIEGASRGKFFWEKWNAVFQGVLQSLCAHKAVTDLAAFQIGVLSMQWNP